MAYRLALQVAVFLLPFVMYAIYRLLVADAQADGRKVWPINSLFGAGAALTIGLWTYLTLRETKERDICHEPARVENGVLVPGSQGPCAESREIINVGAPSTDSPGSAARGFGVRPRDDVSRADEVTRPPREGEPAPETSETPSETSDDTR
ncbi:MAG: DUF6111 family protein [Pseudomonadota bacterium]